MNVAVLLAYALGVSLVLATSAWLLERGLTSLHLSVRWVWLGALGLSAWLALASVVSAPMRGGAVDTVESSAVVAPMVLPAGAEVTGSGSRGGPGAVLELLAEWRTGVTRALASGVAVLPAPRLPMAWIGGAWGSSSMLVAMVFIASILRLYRRAKEWPDIMLLGRQVKVSRDVGPATVGLLTRRIVIPRWASELPHQELELVLRHEGEHVRSRDTLLLTLGLLAVVACPWNPLVWWQLRRLKAAVEVDCDRRVLRNGVAPAGYGNLLLRLGSRGRFGSLTVPTMAGSTSLLERRLTVMKNLKARTSLPTVLFSVPVGLILTVVACTTEAPVSTEPQPISAPSTAVNAQADSEPDGQDMVAVRVAQDGTVQVNGAVHPLDRVSEAVAPLHTENVVVSLESHPAAPYRVLSAVQDQIRAAGLLRVVFTTADAEATSSPTRDLPTLIEDGLTMVLPETSMPNISEMNVNPRNLLFLDVQPSGRVEARLGLEQRVREIAPEDVEDLWRQEVARNPSLIAVLRTNAEAEYRHMYDVLDALQRAEATRFTLEVAQ